MRFSLCIKTRLASGRRLQAFRGAFLCLCCWGILFASAPVSSHAQPFITSQPQSQTAQLGGTATFSVWTSTSGLVCMWLCNGTPLPGQNTTTLTLSNVRPENVGVYVVQFLGPTGQVIAESLPATLTIPTPDLVITSNPDSQKVFLGNAATFFVTAAGSGTLSYQWLHNGQAIPGATGPQLTVPGILERDAGTYQVRVINAAGGILSAPADLTYSLQPPPTILMPPLDQSCAPGGMAQFEVQAGGTGPFTYVWRHNGTKIAGATGSVLFLNNVQPSDEGEYWVTVTNPSGTATSATARLNVLWLAIAPIADVSLKEGTVSDPIPIPLLGGAQSLANANLSVSSTNPDLISGENVLFSGSGADRFMVILAKPGSSGLALATITAVDRAQTATAQCQVTIIGPNSAPIISNLPSTAALGIGQSVSLAFTVTDAETPSTALQVNATLLGTGPLAAAQVLGQGASRVLVVAGSPGKIGTQSVAVTVRDTAGASTQQVIPLSVMGPRLQAARAGADLIISCLDAPDGGQIEFRNHLSPAEGWEPLGLTPASVGGVRTLRMPAPAGTVFFRWKY